LSVEQLAEAACLSPRQLGRTFRPDTGQSPAKAIENLRLEAARLMLEQTIHPIEVILFKKSPVPQNIFPVNLRREFYEKSLRHSSLLPLNRPRSHWNRKIPWQIP
jgi:methylphosphotriester-DNA--protein-cysteine methyltransferase